MSKKKTRTHTHHTAVGVRKFTHQKFHKPLKCKLIDTLPFFLRTTCCQNSYNNRTIQPYVNGSLALVSYRVTRTGQLEKKRFSGGRKKQK